MAKNKFVLTRVKKTYAKGKSGGIVRVSSYEAYNALVDMANESQMSIGQIASKAIMYAYEHLEYREESEGEDC